MVKINSYLYNVGFDNSFMNVSNIVSEYKKNNPKSNIVSLGVGDVSRPIVKSVIKEMHKAVDDLSNMKTFKGYGASYGYDFLKSKILEVEYNNSFSLNEIYISNGTKTDVSNILELFDINSKVLICDPLYPIYKDGATCLNRDIYYTTTDDNFIPLVPKEKYDIIYLCSPNNPTGVCYTYKELECWVKYALKNNSVILYDNVYSAFIESKDAVKSIYEIKDARKVAIEFKSFSKNASFTGVRCSYYIIPNDIYEGINELWKRRTINRFNGSDYIAQVGAFKTFDESSQKEIKRNINYYKYNSKLLRNSFTSMGFEFYGGIDSPFIWVKINKNMKSMEYFEFLLNKLNIIVIPGIVFGKKGDKYFRVSALAPRKSIIEAIERMKKYYEKEK